MPAMMNALGKTLSSTLVAQGGARQFSNAGRRAISVLAIAIALYHVYVFTIGTYDPFIHRSIHLGTILALCFLTHTFSVGKQGKSAVDLVLALTSLIIMAYLVTNGTRLIEQRLPLHPGSLTPWEILMGVVLTLLIFEAARRILGLVLVLLAFISLVYAYIGPYISGFWGHPGFSFQQIIDFTVFGVDGIFTIPIGVSSTYIILFLIFAGFIMRSGAGDFFTKLAYAITGRFRGGPAKAAVLASAFLGSITGNAVANIAITGSVTIPMMKRIGFEPFFAGAVEAAASKGGHILPPVMASVVFIMSEITGISYWDICLAAAIPAIIYFVGVFVQVHFYSVKRRVGVLADIGIQNPPVWHTLKTGWQYFLPFIAIVGLLAYGYSPMRAALWSIPVVLVASWFQKETRMGIRQILSALQYGVMVIRLIMVATALAGIIIGVVFYTGIGGKLAFAIQSVFGQTLLVPLLLAALFCLVLGLCLSVIASYILTVILVVPAAISLGITPLAAHLFVVYFASVSVITPPMGSAFYQAAAMAGAPPFKTGWAAVRLAVAAFVVPFYFVYQPALLLMGNPAEIMIAILVALAGVVSLAVAIEGWLLTKLSLPERVLLISAGVVMLFGGVVLTIVGIVVLVMAVSWHWVRNKRMPPSISATAS